MKTATNFNNKMQSLKFQYKLVTYFMFLKVVIINIESFHDFHIYALMVLTFVAYYKIFTTLRCLINKLKDILKHFSYKYKLINARKLY